MTVYMLRKTGTDLYWRRSAGYICGWVEQQEASVWTAKQGITSAQLQHTKQGIESEIIPFELVANRWAG